MSDIQIKSTGNIRVKLHPVGAGSITSDLRDGVDLDAYPKFEGAVLALESFILTLALAKVDVGSHVFGSAVQQTIDGITMILLDAEALRQMGAPTPITENVSELPAQSGVSNKPATLEVDDIRSHIFERINNRQQDRPFTRDRLEDGNWKFVHNLDAKTAVDQQMKRLRAIELERNALRTEVEELKKRIQLSFEQRETEFREMGSTLNAAVQFANKVERGDVRFAKSCDEQLTAISQIALGKRLDENLADAVARVLSERDETRGLLSAMLKERDELRKTAEQPGCDPLQVRFVDTLTKLTGSMQRLWERLPDDADSTQEAQFDGLNEAHQLLSELKKKQTECGAVQEDLGIACSPSSVPRLVCEFIEASSLVPEGWKTWFWDCISENAPFTWGDLNRALVTASDFLGHCDTRLLDASNDHGVPQEDIDNFLCVLNKLGETYVDLEN